MLPTNGMARYQSCRGRFDTPHHSECVQNQPSAAFNTSTTVWTRHTNPQLHSHPASIYATPPPSTRSLALLPNENPQPQHPPSQAQLKTTNTLQHGHPHHRPHPRNNHLRVPASRPLTGTIHPRSKSRLVPPVRPPARLRHRQSPQIRMTRVRHPGSAPTSRHLPQDQASRNLQQWSDVRAGDRRLHAAGEGLGRQGRDM